MVDLVLLEKFLNTLIPEEAKIPVHAMFQGMTVNRVENLCSGLNHTQPSFKSENIEVRAGTINGILLGITLAQCSAIDDTRKIFSDYIERYNRAKGENVVDFFSKKAGRT